jgi:hypothetical protein
MIIIAKAWPKEFLMDCINFVMFSTIFQYLNSSKNPNLIMHPCLVFNSYMFPRSFSSFSGNKSSPSETWPPSLNFVSCPLDNVNAIDDMNTFKLQTLLELSKFDVFEILLDWIDCKDIIKLFDSQFDPTL